MRGARRLAALAALALLGACSGGGGDAGRDTVTGMSTLRVAGQLGRALRERSREPEAFTLTREQLQATGFTQPLLLARRESGAVAGLVPLAANRGHIVWGSEDGIALTGRGDLIVATRGLGGDLLAAETDPLLSALVAQRGARYRRALRRLDGEGQVLRQDYDCALAMGPEEVVTVLGRAHPTRRSTETCQPVAGPRPAPFAAVEARPFVNTYNVGDGTIWTSRQYVGPAVGYLALERVIE